MEAPAFVDNPVASPPHAHLHRPQLQGEPRELGGKHRRGGYRDPESQAFIESSFGKLKEREVWLNEYEILDDARQGIGRYVDRYHHWPPLGPQLPDARKRSPGPRRINPNYENTRPSLSTPAGSTSHGRKGSSA